MNPMRMTGPTLHGAPSIANNDVRRNACEFMGPEPDDGISHQEREALPRGIGNLGA